MGIIGKKERENLLGEWMVMVVMLTLSLIHGLHGLTGLALSPFSSLALVSSCESLTSSFSSSSVSFLLILQLFFFLKWISWASGALDPESTTSDDLVTSVKRFPLSLYFMFFFLPHLNPFIDTTMCLLYRGVWAMIAVFLAYSLLQAPST